MNPRSVIIVLTVISFFYAASVGSEDQKASRTFLDTLNSGKELIIANPDSARPSSGTKPAAVGNEAGDQIDGDNTLGEQREAGVVPSRFMVQVIASTSQQQVKQEKRNLAAKIKLPLSISYEAPYYKLFAGNAPQREEAENVLAQIKKLGYNDAWIVRTAATKR
jgi:hypothetical protein